MIDGICWLIRLFIGISRVLRTKFVVAGDFLGPKFMSPILVAEIICCCPIVAISSSMAYPLVIKIPTHTDVNIAARKRYTASRGCPAKTENREFPGSSRWCFAMSHPQPLVGSLKPVGGLNREHVNRIRTRKSYTLIKKWLGTTV